MAVPVRTCIGCRQPRPQAELVRIGRLVDGSLQMGRRLAGRGAWLCSGSVQCFDLAARRNAFSRALRAGVTSEAVADLRQDFVRPLEGARP